MKIAILTAMHARYSLNNIFGMAMSRLKRDFDIDTYVAVTAGEKENIRICDKHGLYHIQSKNNPVSDKFNKGLSLLRKKDWTHVMILGSDDIPSNKFIELQMAKPEMDFIAIDDMWFWGLNPKRAGWDQFYYWKAGSSRLGAGRTISRRVVEALDYQLWPTGYDSGLDGRSWTRVSSVPDLKKVINSQREAGGFLVDIKYELHISTLSPIMSRCAPIDTEIIWDHLPYDECEAIFRLRERVKKENYL